MATPLQLLVMTVAHHDNHDNHDVNDDNDHDNHDDNGHVNDDNHDYIHSSQVLEITIFVINEVIGRSYIGAVDAGDTIFVHIFGAYFGLTVARFLCISYFVF